MIRVYKGWTTSKVTLSDLIYLNLFVDCSKKNQMYILKLFDSIKLRYINNYYVRIINDSSRITILLWSCYSIYRVVFFHQGNKKKKIFSVSYPLFFFFSVHLFIFVIWCQSFSNWESFVVPTLNKNDCSYLWFLCLLRWWLTWLLWFLQQKFSEFSSQERDQGWQALQ